MAKNKFAVGNLVTRAGSYAVIKSRRSFGDGHYRLYLEFITPPPSVYYSVSDGWTDLGKPTKLMLELF